MEISVIIPVYNQEKYIKKCLLSVQNQTLSSAKYEVLIINDGSTDRSMEIIKNFIIKNDNFRVISQLNQGLFEARRTGLKNVAGKFVSWVDADDFVESDYLEKLYTLLVKNDSELAYCDYNFYPQKIKTKEKWFRKYNGVVDVSFVERNSQPWNKLVSRSLLERLNIGDLFVKCYDEAYIKVLMEAKNPTYSDEKLYHYRVGGDTTMSSSYKNVEHYKKFIESSKELKKEMNYICNESSYWDSYFEYRVLYYSLITMIVSANSSDKKTFYEMKNKLNNNNNMFFRPILIKNFGYLRYFVLSKIMIINYYVSRFICKIIF